MILNNYRTKLEQKKGQRIQLVKSISDTKNIIKEEKLNIKRLREAQLIIQTVAQETQKQLTYHVNHMVSLALSSVFNDPYTFCLEFVVRNSRTEADINFLRDGCKFNPMDDSGGGPIVIAAFVLRIALWSLKGKETRNTFLLDEPFIRLKERYEDDGKGNKINVTEYNKKAGQLLKRICDKLNIQIIMVSHTEEIIDSAEAVFDVEKIDNKSRIRRIK